MNGSTMNINERIIIEYDVLLLNLPNPYFDLKKVNIKKYEVDKMATTKEINMISRFGSKKNRMVVKMTNPDIM
jgi:hypothetical protein